MEDTSMEDFSLTQIPSAATVFEDPKTRSVVWNAPKASNSLQIVTKNGESSRAQDSRLSQSQSLPSTSSLSLDQDAISLSQSCSNPTRKRKRERPLARRSLGGKQLKEKDDTALIDSLPITPEMIQNMFRSVTERVEAEVAKAKAREEARAIELQKARKEQERTQRRAARAMRESLKNIGEGSSLRIREVSARMSASASTLSVPAAAAFMDVDEPRISSVSPSSSQQSTQSMLPPELVQARSADGTRSAKPLAPSSISSRAEVTDQTKAGAQDGFDPTPRITAALSRYPGGTVPSSVSQSGESVKATNTPMSSQPASQSAIGLGRRQSGGDGRAKSSMIPVSSSASRPPTLGMRRTTVGMSGFSMSQDRNNSASSVQGSQSGSSRAVNYSPSTAASSSLPTRQKQFKPPLARTNPNKPTFGREPAVVLNTAGQATYAAPSATSPHTPSQDRQSFASSGLPTPSSSTSRPLPSVTRFMTQAQAPRQPSPLRKSIVPTSSAALISPPPSQVLSQVSVMSAASPPPPSMDVDMLPQKRACGDRSSSPSPEANISFSSSEFDISLDAEELEKVCSMYD